jgi:fructose-bisphosphate aldolase class II
MPVATAAQYRAMLDAAAAGGYALPAVNVTSSETLNGVLRGLAEAGADGIVQVTTGGAEFLSGAGDMTRGARALAEVARVVAAQYPVLVGLHTDHAPPERFEAFVRPLIEITRRAGQPLFHSHMFDGSSLPLEDNLRIASALLAELAPLEVVLEIEVGVVGGVEDGIAGDARYTTEADLMRVVDALGAGERGRYLLAATFGNVHGVYAPGEVVLRPSILRAGQVALAERRPGARFDYVFHGSSGSAPAEVRAAIANGVVKVNLDSEAQRAFTSGVAEHLFAHYEGGGKQAYDPRVWGAAAEAGMAARVATACEQLGSDGRSITR